MHPQVLLRFLWWPIHIYAGLITVANHANLGFWLCDFPGTEYSFMATCCPSDVLLAPSDREPVAPFHLSALICSLIRGDYVVCDATLNRFFSFHVIAAGLVPGSSCALAGAARCGSNNPDGVKLWSYAPAI